MTPHPASTTPSDWVCRWAPLIPAGGTVLDLACGSGRHVRWLSSRGWRVTGVDRDASALEPLRDYGDMLVADLEDGSPWPLGERTFDGVVVTHYLWRPLMPNLQRAVAPGGVLIYETFGSAQARIGRPSRPEFLLQPGELLRSASGMRVVAYEDGVLEGPRRAVQRMCAVRELTTHAGDPDPGRLPSELFPAHPDPAR